MERIDIGDNSAKFVILPTDTLATIHTELTSYLTFRGWTLIKTVGVLPNLEYATYSSPTLNGGTKRIKLSYFVQTSVIWLGISVLSESESEEVGFSRNAFTTNPNFSATSLQIRSSGVSELYCFASIRWCFFTANPINSSESITSHRPSPEFTGYMYSSGGSWFYGTWSRLDNPIKHRWHVSASYIAGVQISKSISEYEGEVGELLPSLYDHDLSPIMASGYSLATVSGNNEVTLQKKSVLGCAEVMGSDSPTPFVFADTCSLLKDKRSDISIEYAVRDALLTTAYQNGTVGRYAMLEPTRGHTVACCLPGDAQEYGDITKGKDALKFDGKNLLGEIHTAASTYGYCGKLLGLYVTQASSPSTFLQEVLLRVDENYELASDGQLRKFFVVPGYSSLSGSFNRRRWKVTPEQSNSATLLVHANADNLSGYAYTKSTVVSNGHWVDDVSGFNISDNSSFLLPA